MNVSNQPKLTFNGVDIVQFDFKSLKNFNFEADPTISVDAKLVNAPIDALEVRLWMKIVVEAEGYFTLTLISIGNFELLANLTTEERTAFININTPAIMFPYMRSFVSTFTANCGQACPLLIIPTQFFNGPLSSIEIK